MHLIVAYWEIFGRIDSSQQAAAYLNAAMARLIWCWRRMNRWRPSGLGAVIR